MNLDSEEKEKTKFFVDATLKIMKAFDKMLEDNRIDEEVRKEYALMIKE